jgi:hypothetical protein
VTIDWTQLTPTHYPGPRYNFGASKNIELQYWVNSAQATNGLGVAMTTGEVEVYCNIVLHRRS